MKSVVHYQKMDHEKTTSTYVYLDRVNETTTLSGFYKQSMKPVVYYKKVEH